MMEHSSFLERTLAAAVRRALSVFPIVVIVGPRQVGKTVLVREPPIGDGRLYLSLDEIDLLGDARTAPDRFLDRGERVTVDEVQRAPDLLLAMKRAVDRRRVPGRFLVTGSADVRGLRDVADRLPGRAVYLDLEPLSAGERRGKPHDEGWDRLLLSPDARAVRDAVGRRAAMEEPLESLIRRGGLPDAALMEDDADRDLWFAAYVRSWLERTPAEISRIDEIPDLRRLMLAVGARLGGCLNQADAARDAALARTTAHRYVALLTLGRLVDLVPAYGRGLSVRVAAAPKAYFRDPGIAAHLVGPRPGTALRGHRSAGALLENLVLANLRAWASARTPAPEIYHWRTHAGREVDFVVEVEGRTVPVEVKWTSRPGPDDWRGIDAFLGAHPDAAPYGVVLHGGPDVETPDRRLVHVPLARLL